jgi:hypothetical protein
MSGTLGSAQLSFAVADDRNARLRLAPGEAQAARALAASMTLRIDPRTTMALGYAQAGEALTRVLAGRDDAAFLVAGAADRDAIDRDPGAAVALRHAIGAFGIGFAAERGVVRHWDELTTWQRRDYASATLGLDAARGPATAAVRVTRLHEADTLLGARLGPALGGGGAVSWFADVEAAARFGAWRVGAAWREGRTTAATGMARGHSVIASRALAVDITRTGVAMPGDRLALRWSQPLHVTQGALELTALGGLLDLAPHGNERVVEAVYSRPLGAGWLTGNAFVRRQPGNIAAASDDAGVALRYALAF